MFFKKYTANDWCSSKLKLTPAQCFLENYLQHPKKSYFPDIQDDMILFFKCTKYHGTHLTTCAKKHKKVWKSWKENTTLTIYTSLMQCNFATILSIIYFNYFFWKLKLKVWDQRVKETMIRYTMQSEQSIQICFLYVQTKYKF